MNKHQVILLVVGVILVLVLYNLPRVVVENDQITNVKPHDLNVSDTDNEVIISLQNQLSDLSDKKKSINFADSLASLFLKYQLVDSAGKYAELILSLDSSALGVYRAGMIYYQAFENAAGGDNAILLAEKARAQLEKLLLNNKEDAFLKNKIAMTLMVSENPMQGVMMLREVLEKDPENREAIFNLGLLAIRSGQYDRAQVRFEKLIEQNTEDHEAYFYLGVSFVESGQNEKAIEAFAKYMTFEKADAALKATASNYIKELENI
ncbi:MAG: tetratricopeptide repeat protein [Cyclobacteriaceae bacterium]